MKVWASWLLFISSIGVLHAQDDPSTMIGEKHYTDYSVNDLDTISMINGNVMLHIPIYALKQKGHLPLTFSISGNNLSLAATKTCIANSDGPCGMIQYQYGSGVHCTYGIGFHSDQELDVCRTTYTEDAYQGSSIVGTSMYPTYEAIRGGTEAYHLYQDYNAPTKFRSTENSGFLMSGTSALYTDQVDLNEPHAVNSDFDLYDRQGTVSHFSNLTLSATSPGGPYTYQTRLETQRTDTNGNYIQRGFVGPLSGRLYYKDTLSRQFLDGPREISTNTGIDSSVSGCPTTAALFQPATASYTWIVPGPQASQTYLFCFATIRVRTNFFGLGPGQLTNTGYDLEIEIDNTINVLQSVKLPDGTSWKFEYDGADPNNSNSESYGDLKKIVTPQGGSISYTYQNYSTYTNTNGQQYRGLATRTVDDSLGHGYTWEYHIDDARTASPITITTRVVDPIQSGQTVPNETVHLYGIPQGASANEPSVEIERRTYQGSASNGVLLESVSNTYQATGSPYLYVYPLDSTSVLPSTVATTRQGVTATTSYTSYDSGFTTTQTTCYRDYTNFTPSPPYNCSLTGTQQVSFGLPKYISQSHYGGLPARDESTSYKWEVDNSYLAANLLSTVLSKTVSDSADNVTTLYGYDEANGSPQGAHGNVTSVSRAGSKGGVVSVSSVYDSFGRVLQAFDGRNNKTEYEYNDSSSGEVTKIRRPMTNGVAHDDSYTYNSSTGQLLSHTDQNGSSANDVAHTTNYTYDMMGRLTDVLYPATTYGRGEVKYCYTDTGGSICPAGSAPYSLYTTTLSLPDPSVSTIQRFDGLGRSVKSILQSDPQGAVSTDTVYDGLGRVASVTNPYRSTPAASDPPAGTTSYTYDALGRTTKVTNPDASFQQWCYDGIATTGQTNCLSNQSSVTAASWVDFSDEQGHHSQKAMDALGRLVAVREASVTGTGLGYETDYSYDVLGNLTNVKQNGASGDAIRYRSFAYDSLSRLTASCNPETLPSGNQCASPGNTPAVWSNTYSYDSNGNLTQKSDARNVTINYSYDNLNRITSKTYSGSGLSSGSVGATPATCYQYDLGPAATTDGNFVGHLTYEWTTTAGCTTTLPASGYKTLRAALAYDAMGRLRKEQQCHLTRCTTGTPYTNKMDYNLAGNQVTYSNGMQSLLFTNHYDAAGHLSSLNSSWVDGTHPALLYSGKSYIPSGASSSMTFGTGINVNRSYDSRLRPTQETAQHP